MPVQQRKTLIWKCLVAGCDYQLSGMPVEEMKVEGFEHQKTHNMVTDNRTWFDNHVRNYYLVTSS